MNVATMARLLEVHPDTVRRWTREYKRWLSPTATPAKGKTRDFTAHDAAIMTFIATSRESSMEKPIIEQRLAEMQANEWRDLAEAPQEWFVRGDELIKVEQAAIESTRIAQIATLNLELDHTRAQLEQAQQAVETAQTKIQDLENEIRSVRASETAQRAELNNELVQAQLDLATARGAVDTLKAHLGQYSMGAGKPLPVIVIIAVSALAAAALVLAVFVAARLML